MNKLRKIATTGLAALVLSLGASGCGEQGANDVKTEQVQKSSNLRNVVLSYLSQPNFSGSDFMEQITGTRVEMEKWNLNEDMLYFSIPKNSYTENTLSKLTLDSESVEFATASDEKSRTGEKITLGNYVLGVPETYFFRFPSKNFKVDKSSSISIPYGNIEYSIDMQELCDFSENKSIFGGSLCANTGKIRRGRAVSIANHGAFVAKKGEKSLDRLVDSIAGSADSKEERAQMLLDFVTKKIEYDHSEADSGAEVLKRPNEILMTKKSDCSGKTILYASLLEQADIDYRLLYSEGHISVAVEGDYPNRNGLNYEISGKNYSIAETTTDGFRIGKSILKVVKDIKYIQDPGKDSKIYNAKTGKALSFD
jgi:hypothetical protein